MWKIDEHWFINKETSAAWMLSSHCNCPKILWEPKSVPRFMVLQNKPLHNLLVTIWYGFGNHKPIFQYVLNGENRFLTSTCLLAKAAKAVLFCGSPYRTTVPHIWGLQKGVINNWKTVKVISQNLLPWGGVYLQHFKTMNFIPFIPTRKRNSVFPESHNTARKHSIVLDIDIRICYHFFKPFWSQDQILDILYIDATNRPQCFYL